MLYLAETMHNIAVI